MFEAPQRRYLMP